MGFRHWGSTIDQINSLTQDIEDRFLAKNKARAVFVDLTAAYHFVRYRGLTCELLRILPVRNTFRMMMMELISILSFTLTTGLGQQRCEHPLSPDSFNSRLLRSRFVSQFSRTPHKSCHQRCLANCDWMPASYISRQPSNPCRNPIYRASSHHIVSSTPCHGTWASAPLSAHPSIECRCTAPQIKTPNCTHHTRTHQFI